MLHSFDVLWLIEFQGTLQTSMCGACSFCAGHARAECVRVLAFYMFQFFRSLGTMRVPPIRLKEVASVHYDTVLMPFDLYFMVARVPCEFYGPTSKDV